MTRKQPATTSLGEKLVRSTTYSGKQPSDPVRAAESIIRIVEADNPPKHLVLGSIALDRVRNKLKETLTELEGWADASRSADYPDDQR